MVCNSCKEMVDGFIMQRFLYLNNDSLYSYISQIDDGLQVSKKSSTTVANSDSRNNSTEYKGTFSADLKHVFGGINASLGGDFENNHEENNSKEFFNSIEKKVSDEAFAKLKGYLDTERILKTAGEKLQVGDFLELNDDMFIVDLEYYKNIFSNDQMLELFKNVEVNERFDKQSTDLMKEVNESKRLYNIEKLKKSIKKDVDLEYEGTKKIIEVILNIIPYNKFGIMGDCLIVLDDEYFRDKTKVVAYKYGGKMTMVGYMTNIVSNNETQATKENVFRIFPSVINAFMLNFFKKSEIKIVHPIAIYY